VFKLKRGRRLIAQSVGVVVAGGSLALVIAATGSASTTLNLTNKTPITANGSGCSDIPSDVLSQIPSTDDIWHFVVTGQDTFASVSPVFSPSTGVIGPIYEHGMTQAYFGTTAGAVLESATADVNGDATNPQFTLSSSCATTSSSSPPPSPSGSPTPSTSPSSPGSAPTPTPVHTNLPVTG
jgi:hypothetical protein